MAKKVSRDNKFKIKSFFKTHFTGAYFPIFFVVLLLATKFCITHTIHHDPSVFQNKVVEMGKIAFKIRKELGQKYKDFPIIR